MRTSIDNPFSPGSDAVPEIWAGRVAQLSDWRDVARPRRMAGAYERGRTILGEPGSGKSALVRRIAQEASADGDWVTPQIRVPLGSDPLKLVSAAMLALADAAGLATARERRMRTLIGRVRSVAASGVSLGLDGQEGPEPFTALTELLVEIGKVAMRQDRMVVVHVDEVQNVDDQRALSQLLIALGDALAFEAQVEVPGGVTVSRWLPIMVYLTGLPDFEEMAGARRGATFARRFQTFTLGAIDDPDVSAALQGFRTGGWPVADGLGGIAHVRMEPAAAAEIVRLSHGEPFIFQLAGGSAWNAGTGEVISLEHVRAGWRLVQGEASGHVERILTRLPSREREFLQGMVTLPPEERSLTKIAAAAGFAKATDAGPTTQRLDRVRGLIARGRPYSFRNRALEAHLTDGWPLEDGE